MNQARKKRTGFEEAVKAESELSQQELFNMICSLPSGPVFYNELMKSVADVQQDQREAAITELLTNLVQTVEHKEQAINSTFEDKIRDIRDEHTLAKTPFEKIKAVLQYLQFHLQKLVSIHSNPSNPLPVLSLQVAYEWNKKALLEEMVEGFPEEQKFTAFILLQSIDDYITIEIIRLAQEKGKAPTKKEMNETTAQFFKSLPAIAYEFSPTDFDEYVKTEYEFSDGPGRPRQYEEATDNYLKRWKAKRGNQPALRTNVDIEIVKAVMREEGASPSEIEAYKKGIQREIARRIPGNKAEKKKIVEP